MGGGGISGWGGEVARGKEKVATGGDGNGGALDLRREEGESLGCEGAFDQEALDLSEGYYVTEAGLNVDLLVES
jgi:hypothetical protein